MRFSLETARLRLAPFTPEDAADLHALHRDPEVNRYRFNPEPWTLEAAQTQLERFITHQQEHGFSKWRVTLHDDTFVGRAGLERWPETGEFELGYSFVRAYWGRGFATEAARAVLEWTFANTDLQTIVALVMPANRASRRVLEKIGMKYIEERSVNTAQHAIFSITRDEHARLEEETHG